MTMWVFGYGSLLWNPGFKPREEVIATLPGYHRSFCMRSIHHRGTEEKPGLVLALDEAEGAHCTGVALKVNEPEEEQVLEYLRDFKDEKLKARKNHLEAVSISSSASQGEKTKALKEIEKINKVLAELDDYERDVLYPLATEQVEIDLDDGVKANYPKFGDALKKIPGLS